MLSPNNLRTITHETLRYYFGVSLAELTAAELQTVLWTADTADREGADVRAAVEECWRRLRTAELDLKERTIRKDAAHERRNPPRRGTPGRPESGS